MILSRISSGDYLWVSYYSAESAYFALRESGKETILFMLPAQLLVTRFVHVHMHKNRVIAGTASCFGPRKISFVPVHSVNALENRLAKFGTLTKHLSLLHP